MATLLHRIAPHLIVGLGGLELTAEERSILESMAPAGVILFPRNVSSPDQLEALTGDAGRTITHAAGMPPLIMADHEGGRISVLSGAIGTPPTQMAVARSGDLELCRRLYRDTARRLSACGVNVMLGPVADVNTERLNPVIGTRSFGDDPARVAVLVRESVRAIRDGGIAACIKHFPGHGSTVEDSHMTLPRIRRLPHELKAIDRPPFGAGIWAGAEMVMMGHIIPPEGSGPSTLEAGIIVGILREELGFDGIVVTDALEMEGVRLREGVTGGDGEGRRRPLGEIVGRAVAAGNDLLLFSRPVCEVYDELGSADMKFAVDPRSARRIENLRWGLERERTRRTGAGSGVATERNNTLYRKVAARSIKAVRDPHVLLPLRDAGQMRILFVGERADFSNDVVRRFVNAVVSRFDRRSKGEGAMEANFESRLRPHPEESGFEMLEHESEGIAEGGLTVLFFLNRRPLGGDSLNRMVSGADVVIDTDWPYTAELIDPEAAAITTFGVYEAVAEELLDSS